MDMEDADQDYMAGLQSYVDGLATTDAREQHARQRREQLKNMFGEQQMTSLADYIQAALMLGYNGRTVG